MKTIALIVVVVFTVKANWPIDNEPYGFLGCKQLQYRGLWECVQDSIHPDEAIDGVCISISLANIMMYYQWPTFSRFDGIYLTTGYDGIIKHIDRRWNYQLITGARSTYDCETDDPHNRHTDGNPSWSGIDEMHRLVYAVERSFGFDSNYFKTKDTSACRGDGYFAIEHVLRNRFGYPDCMTIDALKKGSRTAVVNNLKQGLPVIAMRCDHAYILDGYKFDPKKRRDLIHSSDYLQGETSIGWFPWKAFYNEKLDRFVIGIHPQHIVPGGPDSTRISYFWGEGYIPGTQYTERRGRLFIFCENDRSLGNINVRVESVDLTPYADDNIKKLYQTKGNYTQRQLTVPEKGYIDFAIGEAKKVDLIINNKDSYEKKIRVLFCDMVKEKS